MQELRLVLIIVGALAIAALLLHGLWSSRKEKPAKFGEKPLGKLDEPNNVDEQGFDKDGVGSVRVVNSDTPATTEKARPARKEPELHFGEKLEADPLLETPDKPLSAEPAMDLPKMSAQQDTPPAEKSKAEPVAPSLSPEPEPAMAAAEPVAAEPSAKPAVAKAPQPSVQQPEFQPQQPAEPNVVKVEEELPAPTLAPMEEMTVVEPSEEPLQAELAAQPVQEPQEPVLQEPQIAEEPEAEPEPEPEPELKPDYLVLNVHARNGKMLRGTKLFNSLEQNNLIFGENSVYHRHADLAGTEPVIFSVTNMVHPGNFPEGGADSFETPGIAFYLMLPCHGRADHNFNLMLQTVQRVADELGADVLDHERVMITPQRIDEYREKAKLYTRA